MDGLLAGKVRFWNPGMFGGMSPLESPGLGLFSPFNFLFFLIPSAEVMTWIAFLTAILGWWGMVLLGRTLTRSEVAAHFAAIAYVLSGYVLSSVHNYGFFAGACLYPLSLWAYFCKRKVAQSVFLAWIVIEGDPLGFAVVSLFCLCHAFANRKFCWPVFLAILLSAFAWLPGVFASGETQRGEAFPLSVATLFSLSPKQLVQWIVPSYWGFFNDSTFTGGFFSDAVDGERFWVDSLYIGIAPILIAFLSFRRYYKIFLIAGFALLLALGKYVGLYSYIYQILPGWDRLRYPARFYAFFNLAVCIAVAHGMKSLEERASRKLAWAVVLLTACDLFYRSPPLSLVPTATVSTPSGLKPFLQERENPSYRLLRDGMLDFRRGRNPARETLADNWATLEGIRSVFGYEPTLPARLYPLMRPSVFESLPVWKRVLGVEYVLTPIHERNQFLKKWHNEKKWTIALYQAKHDLVLLRSRETSHPFEFFSHAQFVDRKEDALQAILNRGGEAGPAILEGSRPTTETWTLPDAARYYPQEQELEYSSKGAALVVFRDRFAPGWKAYIGANEIPLQRMDYFNRGAILPAGQHTVRLVFFPFSFYWGLWISVFTWAGLVAFLKRDWKLGLLGRLWLNKNSTISSRL